MPITQSGPLDRIIGRLFGCCILISCIIGCGTESTVGGSKYGDGSVKGSGTVISKTFDVHAFKGVSVEHPFDVNIAHGQAPRVIISADDNIAPLCKPRIKDEMLSVDFKQGFQTRNRLRIRIETPNIERITHRGVGNIIIDNLNIPYLELKNSSSGNISGLGKIDKMWLEVTGNGNVQLEDVISKETEVLLTGKGRIGLMVTDRLEATNIGRGEIVYSGAPPITNIDNSGKGTIRKK